VIRFARKVRKVELERHVREVLEGEDAVPTERSE
jgi:hypothetical protein